MNKLILILLLLSSSVFAERSITNELCENFAKKKEVKPWYDLSELSKENAEKGIKTMQRLLAIESNNYDFDFWSYSEAEFHVRGYLMKRELIDAWKNKEHDADEIGNLCTLWLHYATAPLISQSSNVSSAQDKH